MSAKKKSKDSKKKLSKKQMKKLEKKRVSKRENAAVRKSGKKRDNAATCKVDKKREKAIRKAAKKLGKSLSSYSDAKGSKALKKGKTAKKGQQPAGAASCSASIVQARFGHMSMLQQTLSAFQAEMRQGPRCCPQEEGTLDGRGRGVAGYCRRRERAWAWLSASVLLLRASKEPHLL